MATKRTEPTPKEAARAAAPQPAAECYNCADVEQAKVALKAARTLPDILAVMYALPPAERGKLHDEVVEARNRVLGVA